MRPTAPIGGTPGQTGGAGGFGASRAQPGALDRPIRSDDFTGSASVPRVSFSAFAYLFSEICSRANQVPTKVKSVVETEERLAALGLQVGIRSIPLAALREPGGAFRQRPLTMEAALKLVTEKLWVRWFGRAAELQKDTATTRYFITDDDPLVVRHVHPTPDYIDSSNGAWYMTYASFVSGMIKGVLDTCLFPAQVNSYHQPEMPLHPRLHWFVIEFEPHVWDRARRQRTN